jgi:hypothetical protein
MPLDTSISLSARPCQTTPPEVVPTATAPSGVMRTHDFRLALLPSEILVHIAGYLRPNDALAFGRACSPIFDALRRDVIEPLRLGERIRWINSMTGIQAGIRGALAAPADRRRPLFHALACRVQALHPLLQDPSRRLLAPYGEAPAKPWWDELYAATDPARERLGQARGQADGHGELLTRVLSLPPQARVRLLLQWFDKAEPPLPPVSEWGRVVSALPPDARGKVLALMAEDLPENDEYFEGRATILAAVRASTDPGAPVPADHADVLMQLADRLVRGIPHWEPAWFAQSWSELDLLARGLPLQSQPKVLAQLAECVHRDDINTENKAVEPHPRWQEFIGYVGSHFPPHDVAKILGRLAGHNGEAEDETLERSVREAIVQAARALPGESRASLLVQVVRSSPHDLPELVQLWDEAFLASASVSRENAAALYGELARTVDCLPRDIQDTRWHALAQRIDTAMSGDAMLPVLLDLAMHGLKPLAPQRREALAAIGRRMPAQDRGSLSAALVETRHITPHTWRMQMIELEELPRAARLAPAIQLAGQLFHYPADGAFAPVSGELAADPGGLLCARMPRTLAEALNTLSEMLTLLPLAHRGTVLLGLSSMRHRSSAQPIPWSLPRARWLLEEALKLAPLQHHGIGVVANVLSVVTQRCPNEADARSLLPLLESAVRALPADARASSLLILSSLTNRLAKDGVPIDRWIAYVSALPAEDRDAVRAALSRKRKDAPE